MGNRLQFATLLFVVGISVVFGMVLGGKLNSPEVVFAAPAQPMPASFPGAPEPAPVPEVSGNFADVVERVMPSVVSVTSSDVQEDEEPSDDDNPDRRRMLRDPLRWFFNSPEEQNDRYRPPQIGEGSGFIVTDDGYVVTNHHVVEDADRVTVGLTNGNTYEAEVIGVDPSIDLALLKIDAEELPALALGDSEALRVGQWVIAIGNPLDFEHTVTVGVVSAKQRRVPLRGTDSGVANFIQTDAAINLGNSGGPLIDAGGNVIGINTAITRANYAEGIGFALPINQARRAMEQLRATGSVRRGYIGITMNQAAIDEETQDYYGLPDRNGVLVSRVEPGGPADRAGLRGGDIIREVDGARVRDNSDLIAKISSLMPGDDVDLKVFREGRYLDLTAELADRAEGLAAQINNPGARDPRSRERESAPSEASGLGITVESLDNYRDQLEQLGLEGNVAGVIITDVEYDSQASDKGLQPRMIVTSINDAEIGSLEDWNEAIDGLRPGSTVKLEVLFGNAGRLIFLRVPS